MIRTQIVDLFVPTRSPDIFADKFDSVERLGKHGTVAT